VLNDSTMTDDKQRIDAAKWLFERTLGWIATADVKVGVAVAIDVAMVGGLAAAVGASDSHARTAWAYLAITAATSGIALALFCAAMAAIPRMPGPVSSMIFFARISERSEADFSNEFSKLSGADFLKDLTCQIHRNAQIATAKHQWIRKGLLWSFAAAIPWIASIAPLVKA
jgi:hypothetical protein